MSNPREVDFIGIGSIKSGSTWVSECLREHPEIAFSAKKSRKELQFFSTPDWGGILKGRFSNYDKGLDWYLSQIPQGGKIRGEFSVAYLPDPQAPHRIKKFFPRVKILVILRDPVEMLYSFYCSHRPSVSVEFPPSFREFMATGRFRELGLYGRYLLRYFREFPRERIHIMFFEDIKSRPRKVVRDLYAFLGVDKSFVPRALSKKINPTFRPRFEFLRRVARLSLLGVQKLGFEGFYQWLIKNDTLYKLYAKVNTSRRRYPPLDKKTKDKFKKYYLEDIKLLEKLTGRDLSLWK